MKRYLHTLMLAGFSTVACEAEQAGSPPLPPPALPEGLVNSMAADVATTPQRALSTARQQSIGGSWPYPCQLFDKDTFRRSEHPGFAPPYDIYDSNHEQMMYGLCNSSGTGFQTQIGRPGWFVYSKICEWTGGRGNNSETCGKNSGWREARLDGTAPVGGWLKGYGIAGFALPSAEPHFVAAYFCKQIDGTWRCGCATPACDSHANPPTGGVWSIQGMKR